MRLDRFGRREYFSPFPRLGDLTFQPIGCGFEHRADRGREGQCAPKQIIEIELRQTV
jgi:hypothetical protein